MLIAIDNLGVDKNIETIKCPVSGDGTVLLLPSQVKKYLGSFTLHKNMNVGIILPGNYILDIISEEIIDNEKWLLVSYNNTYYYTPSKYVDTDKLVKGKNIEVSNEEIVKSKAKVRSISKSSDSSNGNEKWKKTLSFIYDDRSSYRIGTANKDIACYNYPAGLTEGASPVCIIKNGYSFLLTSKWKNNVTGKYYYGSNSFGDGGVYIPQSAVNITDKITSSNPPGYAMIYKPYAQTYILDWDKYPIADKYWGLKRGDRTWPIQDWTNGIHIQAAYNNDGTIFAYWYNANDASPIADSKDMFNEKYLGELTVKKSCVIYAMHRKANATSRQTIKNFLDDISVKSLNNNVYIDDILNNAWSDQTFSVMLNFGENAAVLEKGGKIIVTNYVTVRGVNSYIGFLPSSDKNGSVYFVVLADGGVDCIDYNPYPPAGIDTSGIIDSGESGKYVSDNENGDYGTSGSDWEYKDPQYTEHNESNQKIWEYTPLRDTGTKVPGIMDTPTTPPEYDGTGFFGDMSAYNLSDEKPYDSKHLTHINRFHIPTPNEGLSTKSFIFVTRPDLNLFTEYGDGVNFWYDTYAMNPDLKRLPTFKYIARMKGTPDSPGIGVKILESLASYTYPNTMNTPWLPVFSNQANGYDINDREIDIVEMSETFHGNKVLYAEPTFKHKIGGTVTIPFRERRDLTLYYTLRIWIDYIQAISLGYCSPRAQNKRDGILDYAVSLFYITTDETMENILYWEKLTGLIPLTVPDGFFDWSSGDNKRDMTYQIQFAYSFRTVMDELSLAEINNIYTTYKAAAPRNSDPNNTFPMVPNDYYTEYNSDYVYDSLFTRVAQFYGQITDDADSFNSLYNNKEALRKYYYGGWESQYANNEGAGKISDSYIVNNGTNSGYAKFLPNYNLHTRMYGIPYVKGPFIEFVPNASKYVLRWI